MRTHFLLLLALLPCACPGGPGDGDPGDDSDTTDDSETHEPPPLYPDGDRILLYYGHGGAQEDESGWGTFAWVDEHWKDVYGWNSDYRDYIPDDLSAYRAIFFLSPGISGEETFTPTQLELLRGALAAGTRLILTAERDGCAATSPNQLLEGLETSLRLTGSGLQQYQIAETDLISPDQITAGVASLRFRDACYVDPGEGRGLVRYNEDMLLAVERVGAGGEVVVVGDFEFMDDSGPREWADNALLADRLIEVDPALAE